MTVSILFGRYEEMEGDNRVNPTMNKSRWCHMARNQLTTRNGRSRVDTHTHTMPPCFHILTLMVDCHARKEYNSCITSTLTFHPFCSFSPRRTKDAKRTSPHMRFHRRMWYSCAHGLVGFWYKVCLRMHVSFGMCADLCFLIFCPV